MRLAYTISNWGAAPDADAYTLGFVPSLGTRELSPSARVSPDAAPLPRFADEGADANPVRAQRRPLDPERYSILKKQVGASD